MKSMYWETLVKTEGVPCFPQSKPVLVMPTNFQRPFPLVQIKGPPLSPYEEEKNQVPFRRLIIMIVIFIKRAYRHFDMQYFTARYMYVGLSSNYEIYMYSFHIAPSNMVYKVLWRNMLPIKPGTLG